MWFNLTLLITRGSAARLFEKLFYSWINIVILLYSIKYDNTHFSLHRQRTAAVTFTQTSIHYFPRTALYAVLLLYWLQNVTTDASVISSDVRFAQVLWAASLMTPESHHPWPTPWNMFNGITIYTR